MRKQELFIDSIDNDFEEFSPESGVDSPAQMPVVRLDYRVAVYVPAPEYVEEVANFLAREHGGATVLAGHGYWIDDNGLLVRDETVQVFAYTSDPQLDDLLHLAGLWAHAWSQTCVAVECDGAMYLVDSAQRVEVN